MPAETWLVTGSSGFLGRHIAAELHKPSEPPRRVIGLSRSSAEGEESVDLLDRESLFAAIRRLRPDFVIHAAGTTRADDPDLCFERNTRATVLLLESLRALNRPVRVVLLGSAAELGPVPVEDLPVGPEYPAKPISAYGLSKYLATCAGLVAPRPLEVSVARVFNPIGPGLPESQAFGRFARLLRADAEQDPLILPVGDLDTRRDFVDVRDVASAVIAIAQRGRPGTIEHVGTGDSHSIREGLELLITLSGRAVETRSRIGQVAESGPGDSRADSRSLREGIGWTPRFSFAQSLQDLWNAG
jgi:GDP-4-dehydro-6-deoxy-D-mannose reductase